MTSKETAMFHCPYFEKCSVEFFEDYLQSAQGIGFVIEHEFCQVHYEKCARFQVAQLLGSHESLSTLYPTEYRKAQVIVAETLLKDLRPELSVTK